MISAVQWIGHGRLAEKSEMYEIGSAAMDDLITKQRAMNLDQPDHADNPTFPSDSDSDIDEAMDTLGQHIQTHEGGGEGDADTEEADGDAQEPTNGHMEDGDDADLLTSPRPAPSAPASDLFSAPDPTADALLSELAMDDYDDEPDGAELFLGGHKLTVHSSNAEDPYITVKDEDEEGESDEEDTLIRATDCVLCVGRTEMEHSAVEVYIYDTDRGSLFVHHDFQIPSFPLTFQHLTTDPRTSSPDSPSPPAPGAFLAIGTFLPGIEIWNLNVVNALEPVCTLGGYEDEDAVSAKRGKRKLKDGSHEDGVLCLDWHPAHGERLASGGGDELVKLWDVTTQQCTRTLTHHRDREPKVDAPVKAGKKKKKKKGGGGGKKAKEEEEEDDESWFEEAQEANVSHKVQSLHFNPTEPSLLLTGSYDRTVHLLDVRTPTASTRVYRVESDVETVRWHPQAPLFLVATESGLVYLFDARQATAPLFRLSAHSSAATAAAFNPHIPSLFLTSSQDKTVKLWSIPASTSVPSTLSPTLVTSKEMKVGAVWSAAWDVDEAALMACGGDKGKVAVWDVRESAEVRRKYGKELGEEPEEAERKEEEDAEVAAAPSTNGRKEHQKKPKTKGKKKKKKKDSEEGDEDEDEKE